VGNFSRGIGSEKGLGFFIVCRKVFRTLKGFKKAKKMASGILRKFD
jgi:hypothetical protein